MYDGGPVTPLEGVVGMLDKDEKHWRELCDQAAKEQDPAKLIKLMQEINRLLTAEHHRLETKLPPNNPKASN